MKSHEGTTEGDFTLRVKEKDVREALASALCLKYICRRMGSKESLDLSER
jgi:hypothetical protein